MTAESLEGPAFRDGTRSVVISSIGETGLLHTLRRGRHPASRAEGATSRPYVSPMVEILLGSGIFAIGLKFASYWDHWVYFPSFPNVVDTMFLSLAAAFLLGRGIRAWHAEVLSHLGRDESALSPGTSLILMVAITVGLAILLYFVILWVGSNP